VPEKRGEMKPMPLGILGLDQGVGGGQVGRGRGSGRRASWGLGVHHARKITHSPKKRGHSGDDLIYLERGEHRPAKRRGQIRIKGWQVIGAESCTLVVARPWMNTHAKKASYGKPARILPRHY